MHSSARSNAFLDALDLGSAVQRSLVGVAPFQGASALTLAICLAGIDVVCWALAWHYDFQPTISATAIFAARVIPSLPASALPYASLVSLLITLLPTLAEFALPRLAAAGFRVASMAVYGLSLFDAMTDWPNVTATMDAYRGSFDGFGILALPAWWTARIILLAFATHGFELLAFVVGICAVRLLFQARSAPALATR